MTATKSTTNESAATLHAVRLGGPDAARTLVMLHGIYGRGRNWQSIARAVIAARPDYQCVLIDLPHHGDSGPGHHGNTVEGLASDLDDWLIQEAIVPDVVLGHSFGGKVALAYAGHHRSQPLHTWIIDSTPETRPPSGSAFGMLEIIAKLPADFASRAELAEALTAAGYAPGVGQWMSTNLSRDDDRFVWRLDFEVMNELMQSFFTTDLWPIVDAPAEAHHFHFLKASESSAMSDAAVARAGQAPADRVRVHHLRGGHWIHSEAPEIVTALLVDHLP